jgi:dUTP pyrophosphatase
MQEIIIAHYDQNRPVFHPSWAHPGEDAAFDLAAAQDQIIEAHSFAIVGSNICVAMPKDYWLMIVGRSSSFWKRRLITNTSIIDWGYRGELGAIIYNPNDHDVGIEAGESIAQAIPMRLESCNFQIKWADSPDQLARSQRGGRGFGSTGGAGGARKLA